MHFAFEPTGTDFIRWGISAGIFAGLVNPGFLLLAFADVGTGGANPCDAAIERAYETIEADEK